MQCGCGRIYSQEKVNKLYGKKVLQQLSAYKQGMQIRDVKEKYQLDRIVKLSSNENPYGYSDKVRQAMDQFRYDFEQYPDGYATEARAVLADYLQVEPDQLVFGTGSDEVITLICRAFLHEGANTVMAAPTFPQYRHHALIEGAAIKEIPTTADGEHDLEKMAAAIDAETKVVWLCTPDNPTGSVISQQAFDVFMKRCPDEVVVVLDEAYYEYVAQDKQFSLQDNLKHYDNLIILRTFSKIYGLAGMRLGYGVGNELLATKLNIARGPFNTTAFTQQLLPAALSDQAFVMSTKEKNQEVRTLFQAFLDTIGWTYYPSETNFLLVNTPINADTVTDYLLRHGFIVRSGNVLGYPDTIRVTIGTKADMQSLQEVVANLHEQIRDGVVE